MPFGPQQFFDVFRQYNESVWPAPIVLTIAAVIATAAVFARHRHGRSVAVITLCALFVWCGVVYQWFHFSRINPAAWLFGVLFIAGGFVFVASAGRLSFGAARPVLGLTFIAYAVAGYPVVAYLVGHRYPFVPTFGAPCPITIFAIGLLMTARPVPVAPAIVPLIWSAIGGSASFALHVREDLGLVAAGIALLAVGIADRVQAADHFAAG